MKVAREGGGVVARLGRRDDSPSMSNPLWLLLQDYMDHASHLGSVRPADIARHSGVSEQVLSKWKSRPTLPSGDQLMKVARATGLSYYALLEAALRGRGYLQDGVGLRAERIEEPREEPMHARLRFRRYRAIDEAWLRQYARRNPVSAAPDEVDDLIAAHDEDEPISGEQGQPQEP